MNLKNENFKPTEKIDYLNIDKKNSITKKRRVSLKPENFIIKIRKKSILDIMGRENLFKKSTGLFNYKSNPNFLTKRKEKTKSIQNLNSGDVFLKKMKFKKKNLQKK